MGTLPNFKFNPGAFTMTQGILALVEQGAQFKPYLDRHLSGDWGDVAADDKAANDDAVRDGDRLVSAYETPRGRIWIITEADRSATTILLPDEY